MASKQIKKNQVVWAKLKGYPWWPSCFAKNNKRQLIIDANTFRQGRVFSLKNIPIDCEYFILIIKQAINKIIMKQIYFSLQQVSSIINNDVVVNFLGEYSHATIKLDQVHDFKENYSLYNKNVNDKNKKLKQAVAIGMRICEGKTNYEEKLLYLKKFSIKKHLCKQQRDLKIEFHQINQYIQEQLFEEDTEDEAMNQTSSEEIGRNKKSKKNGAAIQKKEDKSATDTISKKNGDLKTIRATGKSSSKTTADTQQTEEKNQNFSSQNGGNQKLVPENAGEPSQAASEKELVNSKSQNYKKQQKIKEKMSQKFKQNENKLGVSNLESGADEQADTEPNNSLQMSLQEKDSSEQFSSIKNQKADIGNKSPAQTNQQNEVSQKDDIDETEEVNLEQPKKTSIRQNASPKQNKIGYLEDNKEIVNTSDSNSQQQNGQTSKAKNSIKQSQRNKRATSKNGVSVVEASNNGESDSPKKKIKVNGQQTLFQNPQDVSELQICVERIMETFQNKKSQNIFKLNEMKELDFMCDHYFKINIPTNYFFNSSLGKVFLSTLLYISSYIHIEDYNPEIKQKLESVIENIQDKVLTETFGQEIKEFVTKKKQQTNGNCIQKCEVEQDEKIQSSNQLNKQITSHTKLNGDAQQNTEKESEDPKKNKDQQLRKKICKKINELLKENYNLEKNKAQDLCVKIERKIKSVQPELNHDYKNNVKGLIRLLKASEISIEKLESCEVNELIQIIQNQNVLSDLKSQNVIPFDKNYSNIDQSD